MVSVAIKRRAGFVSKKQGSEFRILWDVFDRRSQNLVFHMTALSQWPSFVFAAELGRVSDGLLAELRKNHQSEANAGKK